MVLRVLRGLWKMMKPVQLALLMLTMYGAYFAAGGPLDPVTLALLTLTGIGSAGGVTALNMYLERDIDGLMERTRSRPLPSGALSDREALFGIVGLIALGTLAASLINRWVVLAGLIGLYFDIIAYTELFKRHTAWAMLAGSVAGAMPALGGWAAGHGGVSLGGVLLAGMVYVWQPLHVSFIHYAYQDQYRRAGVPTLAERLGEKGYGYAALASITGLVVLVWLYALLVGTGLLTAVVASAVGLRAIRAVHGFLASPRVDAARRIIKLASPVLGIVFVFLPIETLIVGPIVGV